MKKIVIGYGVALAVLVALLKVLEYRYFVRSLSVEVYVATVATLFTALGIWIGLKVTGRSNRSLAATPLPAMPAVPPPAEKQAPAAELGISSREWEVLELLAQGLTNQEIADRLFVSLNTVKTHASNLYSKLGVKRRTQAIQRAKELKIIP